MTRKKPMRRRPAEWVGAVDPARRNRRSRRNLPFVGLRLGPWEMPTLACACSNEAATWFCPGGWHGRLAEDGSQISVVVAAVVAICALFFGLLLLSVPYFSFYLLPCPACAGPVQQRSSRIYFAVGYR